MSHDVIIPVILSGGIGSRLWPISRESHPKPFVALPDGQTLLQKTWLRASLLAGVKEIMTITNKEYYLKSQAEYAKTPKTDKTAISATYLLEPCARSTAAAIALAALQIQARYGDEAILLVLPADHLIEDADGFASSCHEAFQLASSKLVTFGITPATPETGFGYIECGQDYEVIRFIEKPSHALACEYLASGRHLWNSGMFCFGAKVVLDAFLLHAPDILHGAKKCWEITQRKCHNQSAIELDVESFEEIPANSIDYAIMEKAKNISVVRCESGWRDIGSWEAYKQLYPSDHNGNSIVGEAITIDSNNNFIHSDGRLIASIGINNLAIIDTPDALLITHRERAQEVKEVVQQLKERAHESYSTHRTVIRPWGSYTVLEDGVIFKIKRIVVKPSAALSLQFHQHRSEHWVVVEGIAQVTNGDKEYILNVSESTFIPKQTRHRLVNPGDKDLVIIEVQTGEYVGEDDIIRLEDIYGRIK